MTHRRNIPTHPGAMTPAQLVRHALTTAAAAVATATAAAIFTAALFIFS